MVEWSNDDGDEISATKRRACSITSVLITICIPLAVYTAPISRCAFFHRHLRKHLNIAADSLPIGPVDEAVSVRAIAIFKRSNGKLHRLFHA